MGFLNFFKKKKTTSDNDEKDLEQCDLKAENRTTAPNEYNFRYLQGLLSQGKENVTLNHDIVLGEGEESEFPAGILVQCSIDGNGHTIDARGKVPILTVSWHVRNEIIIENLILKNGYASNNYSIGGCLNNGLQRFPVTLLNCIGINSSAEKGGAVFNKGLLNLVDCEFKGNSARNFGGGIYNKGKINLKNTKLINNISTHSGGAIVNEEGELSIASCEFRANTSKENGGAIFNLSKISIIDSNFTENASQKLGGAIGNAGKVDAQNITFTKNTSESDGGAIGNGPNCEINLAKCEFNENNAENGGAIINHGKLSMTDSNFANNLTKKDGGAIANMGKFDAQNIGFTKNTSNTEGGAIINGNEGEIILKNCRFNENTVEQAGGSITNYGKLNMNDSNFTNNVAQIFGGAIANINEINIENTNFSNNTSKDRGGAIGNGEHGEINIMKSEFSENDSKEEGGAIYNDGLLELSNSNFMENASRFAGAIYHSNGELQVFESQFRKNNSKLQGGAIYTRSDKTNIIDCEFDENTSTDGGAIHNWGNLNVTDTSFIGNTSKRGGAIKNFLDSTIICSTCEFLNNKGDFGSSIFNECDNAQITNCLFSQHENVNDIVFNNNKLTFNTCFIEKNNAVDSIIISNYNSSLDFANGKILNNENIKKTIIHNKADNLSIYNTSFINNSSSSDEYYCILNEGSLVLQSVKFGDNDFMFNDGQIDIKKLSPDIAERIINGKKYAAVDIAYSTQSNFNFSYLNHLIQENNDTVYLNEDINFENDEYDFFEGGIEIKKDNLIIEGNNHIIDAKNRTQIFNISGKNITLKNIVFKNGKVFNKLEKHTTGGGAIKIIEKAIVTIENCQFIDNESQDDGGAIKNNGTLYSLNNKFTNNISKHYGGAIQNNNILHTKNDAFQENRAKIAGAIYNNKLLTIKEDINLLNNHSDFKQEIYNAGSISMDNSSIVGEEIIYNTNEINKTERQDNESFKYLKDKLENSNEITLHTDIKIEYKDIIHDDEININNNLIFDGNNHVIDLNRLNINFKSKCKVLFKNVIFKNAYTYKNPLFDLCNEGVFENVKFLNNSIKADYSLIRNNESGSLTLIDSSFYNNSTRNKSMIINNGELAIINSNFTNNTSNAIGTIVHIANREKKVLIRNSIFNHNTSSKNGGTIYSKPKTTLEMIDCEFIKNSSELFGGAISNYGKTKLLGCRFIGNISQSGGAMYVNPYSFLNIADCEFKENISLRDGGAINNQENSEINISDCKFNENTAQTDSGAINNWGKLNITYAKLTKNAAKENNGGAINNQGTGELNIINCEFHENATYKSGGAIFNFAKLNIRNTNFSKNTSNYGGAISNESELANIEKCGFDENTSENYGGAIYNDGKLNTETSIFARNASRQGGAVNNQENSEINFQNCNFEYNTSDNLGGAILNGGTCNLLNNHFIENTSEYGGAIINFGKINIDHADFTKNSCKNEGGAINHQSNGESTLRKCEFKYNISQNGGAISKLENKSLKLKDCAFKENKPNEIGIIETRFIVDKPDN